MGGCRDEAGRICVPAAAPGTQPDLSGLSCRFEEIPSTRGLILSVLVVPTKGADPLAFRKVIEDIIRLVDGLRMPGGRCRRAGRRCAGRRPVWSMKRAPRAAGRC